MATNTIIDANQVRKGDKIRVTFITLDSVRTVEGVADTVFRSNNWYTEKDVYLGTNQEGAVIELLDRPNPWEKRRQELAKQFGGAEVKYDNAWPSTKRAIDYIIELEKKEAK